MIRSAAALLILLTLAGCGAAQTSEQQRSEVRNIERYVSDVLCAKGSASNRAYAIAQIINSPAYDDRTGELGGEIIEIGERIDREGCPPALPKTS